MPRRCVRGGVVTAATIWRLIKPWIAARTLARIHFLGADYPAVLAAAVAPENLPVRGPLIDLI